MTVKFYDVKERESVEVGEEDITKTKYERKLKNGTTQIRYALRAKRNGRNLTKFCSKTDWEALNVSEV